MPHECKTDDEAKNPFDKKEMKPTNAVCTIGIKDCSRCGNDHSTLEVRPFTRPIDSMEGTCGFFAMCPNTNEPILIEIIVS